MSTENEREPLIIHHRGCSDGICGAMVIWYGLGRRGDLMPAQYGDKPPEVEEVAGRHVYIVDFSYPRETLTDIAKHAARLEVFDHHKSAAEHCDGLPYCTFDMDQSGAGLALERFRSTLDMVPDMREALSEMVAYVQDRDLWRFDLPESKALNAWLMSWPRNLHSWRELLFFWMSDDRNQRAAEGAAILRRQRQLIDVMLYHARPSTWSMPKSAEPFRASCLLVNAPILQSEIAGALAEREGSSFGVAWWQTSEGTYRYSLRSRSKIDVSTVAECYGGGGHARAAGFSSAFPPEWLFATDDNRFWDGPKRDKEAGA